jgi:hypothetical protein
MYCIYFPCELFAFCIGLDANLLQITIYFCGTNRYTVVALRNQKLFFPYIPLNIHNSQKYLRQKLLILMSWHFISCTSSLWNEAFVSSLHLQSLISGLCEVLNRPTQAMWTKIKFTFFKFWCRPINTEFNRNLFRSSRDEALEQRKTGLQVFERHSFRELYVKIA